MTRRALIDGKWRLEPLLQQLIDSSIVRAHSPAADRKDQWRTEHQDPRGGRSGRIACQDFFADCGYDGMALAERESRGGEASIQTWSRVCKQRTVPTDHKRCRLLVERFFCKLK
jgi:hypothetical protein